MNIHPSSLSDFLCEKFKITSSRRGVQGVIITGNSYNNVVLELATFTLADYEIKYLFEAIEKGLASGFFMVPRGERESDARHYIIFH